MGLPSQGRASGAGMRVSSRVKRPKGVPPAVIPIVVVGLAIAAVWGGYSLLEPAGAGAGQPKAGEERVAATEPVVKARRDPETINSGIESLTSGPRMAPKRGLLGDALDQGHDTSTPEIAEREQTRTPVRTGADTPVGPAPDTGGGALADAGGSVADPIPSAAAPAPARGETGALERARALIAQNDLLGARELMSRALADPGATPAARESLRQELIAINETLVFGPRIIPGDAMSEEYVVAGGDTLGKIARKRELGVHWKLIQRVNRISRPERIQLGQKLKLVRGPFHAVVDKSDFRADIYHGPPSEPERWVYITSRSVGLGELGSTPLGTFMVRQGSKLENPAWVNPRDGREQYGRDDPQNPIGEHWIGLEGVGDAAVHVGYGLHGTIEPDSIGKQMSMGCVRLLEDDIALLYELLEEGISVVKIVP